MKKSIIAFGLALLAFTACNTKKESELKITLPDSTLNGTYIQLVDFNSLRETPTIVDSILVNNNVATYKMPADTNSLFVLKSAAFSGLYIPEAGKQTITISPSDGPRKTYVASETPLNKAMYDLIETTDRTRKAFSEAVEKAKADGSINDSATYMKLDNQYKEMNETLSLMSRAAYTANQANAAGSYVLTSFVHELSLQELDSLVNVGGEAVKKNQRIADMRALMATAVSTGAGKMFTDLEGVNPADTTQVRKLSDYAGKGNYILVDFWASWCGPCKGEMVHLKEAYAKYHKKGLEIVGFVVWDSLEDHLRSAEELKLPWPQILDSKGIGPKTYGIQGIPTLLLIDKDGTIISRELRGEALLAKLAELYK